ncbi:MAG: response regulator [Elusimicrobia bacterium]|nr:response regulator [Elusimicrobiota bacterium]
MGDRKKVLVVDDNPAFTQLIQMALSELYEVFTAGDGQQGLDVAQKELPDAILLDVMMPNISGMEMVRLLQAEPATRNIPIVIVTATRFDNSTKDMFKQEPNVKSFLQKPCGLDDLKQNLEAAFGSTSK